MRKGQKLFVDCVAHLIFYLSLFQRDYDEMQLNNMRLGEKLNFALDTVRFALTEARSYLSGHSFSFTSAYFSLAGLQTPWNGPVRAHGWHRTVIGSGS